MSVGDEKSARKSIKKIRGEYGHDINRIQYNNLDRGRRRTTFKLEGDDRR